MSANAPAIRHSRPGQPRHRPQGSSAPCRRRGDPRPGRTGRGRGRDVRGFRRHDLRDLYREDMPIIALCAAGIVIRTLAPLLLNKRRRAAGAGGRRRRQRRGAAARRPARRECPGARDRRRRWARAPPSPPPAKCALDLPAATRRPAMRLRDPGDGKRFMSDLLAGESVRIDGDAPWLDRDAAAGRSGGARSPSRSRRARRRRCGRELIFHPRTVVVARRRRQCGFAAARAGRAARTATVAASRWPRRWPRKRMRRGRRSTPPPHRWRGRCACSRSREPMAPGRGCGAESVERQSSAGPVAIAIAPQPVDVRGARSRARHARGGRPWPWRCGTDGAGGAPGAGSRRRTSSATKPMCAWPARSAPIRSSTAPTIAKRCSARATPFRWRPRAVRSSWCRPAIPASSPWRRRCWKRCDESDDPAWHGVDLDILPGVSASPGDRGPGRRAAGP